MYLDFCSCSNSRDHIPSNLSNPRAVPPGRVQFTASCRRSLKCSYTLGPRSILMSFELRYPPWGRQNAGGVKFAANSINDSWLATVCECPFLYRCPLAKIRVVQDQLMSAERWRLVLEELLKFLSDLLLGCRETVFPPCLSVRWIWKLLNRCLN